MVTQVVPSDMSAERAVALGAALDLYHSRFAELADKTSPAEARTEFLATAQDVYRWLVGPAIVFLSYGPITDQTTGLPTGQIGATVTQLHDNQQFTLTLTAKDAKGIDVPDDPTQASDDPVWSSSDDTVFTVHADPANPRTATVVAGVPGSAVGTVAVGSVSATFAVDVVPGPVALVQLAEGPVTDQP